MTKIQVITTEAANSPAETPASNPATDTNTNTTTSDSNPNSTKTNGHSQSQSQSHSHSHSLSLSTTTLTVEPLSLSSAQLRPLSLQPSSAASTAAPDPALPASTNPAPYDSHLAWSDSDSVLSISNLVQFTTDFSESLSLADLTSSSVAAPTPAEPSSLSTSTATPDTDTDTSSGRTMERDDPLAIAQNGATVEYSDDESHDNAGDQDLDDDMMDRISSSPSIEDEDIDFDFVYALHTFVATVEGQANAAKGDPMMLLDDSNSYWWLVRVVKDSTIGYLPAEHIETPTERLARLNKHRNLDLSAAMLGDQPEPTRSKTGFKSGILRRRKTVAFAAPTFVDYEKEYSDTEDEEDEAEALFAQQRADAKKQREEKETEQQQATTAATTAGAKEDMDDETAKVKPLSTKPLATKPLSRPGVSRSGSTLTEIAEGSDAEEEENAEDSASSGANGGKADGVSRSRNGTVRNTDSFFKDDTVETKKITLTPNLLRDDNASRGSTESGSRQRPSLDKLEKELSPDKKDDKKKKDKKEKDKKAGGIRGFFSRKEKKKSVDEDEESLGKRSMDTMDSHDRDGFDGDTSSPTPEGRLTPQRTPSGSKLQKQALSDGGSPLATAPKYVAEGPRNDVSNVPPTAIRTIDPEQAAAASAAAANKRLSMSALYMDISGPPSTAAPQPEASAASASAQTNAAKGRMELDDSDSADEDEFIIQNSGASSSAADAAAAAAAAIATDPMVDASAQPAPLSTPTKMSTPGRADSPATPTGPPALMADSASQDGQSMSPSPSPEMMSATDDGLSTRQTTLESATTVSRSSAASTGTSSTTAAAAAAAWNDDKLRMFFESSSDVRDMLVMVYDKSEVVPAGPEHPIAGPLFREQNAKLAEITTQLDHMLGDWLARKQRLRGTI